MAEPHANGTASLDCSPNNEPFIIGVAGGTASGKTTVCDQIINALSHHRVILISQDSFYRSLNKRELSNVTNYNFDHPEAFDTEAIQTALKDLKKGGGVDIPIYDFKSHTRSEKCFRINPADVVIFEGILVFHSPEIRDLMNMKIFVDTDADTRLARRIKRDTKERGRTVTSVIEQYQKFVKPMFDQFIAPTKKFADIIIPRGGDNVVAIDLIVQNIKSKLGFNDVRKLYSQLVVVPSNFQIRGMHTIIRDKNTEIGDFVFYADRLIRLVIEHGLNCFPFTPKDITTPTGDLYRGVDFAKLICGVSIIRSGESMENSLRACCKGIKIGKILVKRNGDDGTEVIYTKLPSDIENRHVLLLDPILATGNSVVEAIENLLRHNVQENKIVFMTIIAAPEGIHKIFKHYRNVTIVTSEIDSGITESGQVTPGVGWFGDRYFGTDNDSRE